MAAKLQCEICGGKLVGKPGGIFECESCGTEYSTAWAKAKIQEIQGTVKVEGTVDVKGTVQVEGPVKVEGAASAQSLIKRGNLALEDRKWEEAENCFDDALNADPENAEAYLGLVMTKRKVCDKEAFALAYIGKRIEADDNNIKRAKQFADNKLKAWFNDLDKKKRSNLGLLQFLEQTPKYRISISAGWDFTVGLKSDGTVFAVGNNDKGQCDVYDWIDIVAVSAGYEHTVGLKVDGTVFAVGNNDKGQCDVQNWADIVAVSAGKDYTVGLKSDGTVVAVGDNDDSQCNLKSWYDIVAISAGRAHTVGLKSDGTVVAVGDDVFDQCDVSAWTDIVAISAGNMHTVGLKADGTVIAVGTDSQGQCNVTYWKGIAAVVAGSFNTIGLKEDGSVIATKVTGDIDYQGQCDVQGWKDVVSVSTKGWFAVGLKSNNTVIAVGNNDKGQCNISNWKLFRTEKEKLADYAKACALQASGEEQSLAEAAALFKGLKKLNDSPDRARECTRAYEEKKAARRRGAKEKLKQKTVAVVAAFKECSGAKKEPTLEEKCVATKVRIESLTALRNGFDALLAQATQLQQEQGALTSEEANLSAQLSELTFQEKQLTAQRTKLGIFAGKEKKRIDGELSLLYPKKLEASNALSSLAARKREFTDRIRQNEQQRCGFDSLADIDGEIAKENECLSNLESQIASKQANEELTYSYEEAIKVYLGEPKVTSAVNAMLYPTVCRNSIAFGRYIQKENGSPEPIEWRVLARENGRMLLISEYALDIQWYNTTSENVRWETCSLRKWLNGTFLHAAFNSKEQNCIISSDDISSSVKDKIFLLTFDQAFHYFSSNSDRKCKGTDYVKSCRYKTGNCNWWLGEDGSMFNNAAYVNLEGWVVRRGDIYCDCNRAVRPALWINLGS